MNITSYAIYWVIEIYFVKIIKKTEKKKYFREERGESKEVNCKYFFFFVLVSGQVYIT